MKKYLFLILLAVLLPAGAQAQIVVKGEKTPKVETIAVVRSYAATIDRVGTNYFLYMKSTNEFDEVQSIPLGKGEVDAANTLGDILRLFETLDVGESVHIGDAAGDDILVIRHSKKWLKFVFEIQAGGRYIKKSDLTYFIQAIGAELRKKGEAMQK